MKKKALAQGLKEKPNLIAIDGGSTDSDPYYLGTVPKLRSVWRLPRQTRIPEKY